jgi:hypothetical protein
MLTRTVLLGAASSSCRHLPTRPYAAPSYRFGTTLSPRLVPLLLLTYRAVAHASKLAAGSCMAALSGCEPNCLGPVPPRLRPDGARTLTP